MRNVLLAIAAVYISGCGSPVAVPAEGIIKLRGLPAGNLILQLTPNQGNGKGSGASALSDPQGRFSFKTDDGRAGAYPGAYKVMIIDNNLNIEDEPTGKGPKRKMPINRIPMLYSSATTPVNLTVEPGKKDYVIDVTGR